MLLASESFCHLFSTSFSFLSLNVQRNCQLNLLLQWAISFVFVDMYILLTKREVKMAGYWPSSVFAFLWAETKSKTAKTPKEIEANTQPS